MRTRINSLWWEWRHSLWLLWTITIFFNWVAFLYIGLRAQRMRWIVWALVYAAPFTATIALARTEYWEGWPGDATAVALIVMSIISLVHALKVRRRYLVLLAARRSLLYAKRNTGTPPASDEPPARAEELKMVVPSSTAHPPGDADAQRYGESGVFRLEAKWTYIVATNIGAMVLGAVLLLLVTLARGLFSPVLYLCFCLVLAFYMVGDVVLWWHRGIRTIEIADAGLTIRRGPAGRATWIPVSQITGVDVFSKLGRKVVNILTGGTVTRLPGVTLFSGPRIRVTSDAFNEGEFEAFVKKVRSIRT